MRDISLNKTIFFGLLWVVVVFFSVGTALYAFVVNAQSEVVTTPFVSFPSVKNIFSEKQLEAYQTQFCWVREKFGTYKDIDEFIVCQQLYASKNYIRK